MLTSALLSQTPPLSHSSAACGGRRRCGPGAGPQAYAYASGTSMAVPAVAGAAAVYLGERPAATPAEVAAHLVDSATPGAINAPGALRMPETPNRVLWLGPGWLAAGGGEVLAAQGPAPP